MRSQHRPMTWQEYESLPMKLGWKHEYWDGQVHITPRHQAVTVTIAVQPRPFTSPYNLRPVTPDDEEQLVAAYFAAYNDTIDFCDWEPEKITSAAKTDIHNFFAGTRGQLLPASRVACDTHPETNTERVIGAALIIKRAEGQPLLDMLFILPDWHRKGVATALVSAALSGLADANLKTLTSRYLLGNEESRAWHQRFGFVEEPDLTLARLYYRHAQHELQQRQKHGDITEPDYTALVAETDRWETRVEELEAIADQQGIEAVLPSLRW